MHQSQILHFELRNELPLAPDNQLFFSCKEKGHPHTKLNDRLIFNHSKVEVRVISALIEFQTLQKAINSVIPNSGCLFKNHTKPSLTETLCYTLESHRVHH
jgi:hypothetical protein